MRRARSKPWNARNRSCRWGWATSKASRRLPAPRHDHAVRRPSTCKSGKVITPCKARHRHQEFLAFLRHLDESVPAALDLHLIIDNYATHKHPKVRAWFAARPRYHVHYTPTYSSWLNQVELWFGLITQRSIRRGSFRSVKQLVQRIDAYVKHHNRHASPFHWTVSADSILGKIERLSKVISGTPH